MQKTKQMRARATTGFFVALCCAVAMGCVRPPIPAPPADTAPPVNADVGQGDSVEPDDVLQDSALTDSLDAVANAKACFAQEITAIIKSKCLGCHSGLVPKFELTGDPGHDYPLVLDKVDTNDPASSLFLKKALGEENHGGQAVLKIDDSEYTTLLQWITDGASDTCTGTGDTETPDSDVVTPTDPPPCSANCHGYPPETGKHRKHTDPKTYDFECTTCHIFPDKHMSGTADLDFSKSLPPNPSGVFSQADKTCSGLYCHGDGKSPASTGSIKWTDSGAGCDTCHKQEKLSGKHQAHLGASLSCANCHKTATSNNAIADYLLHLNGKVDVDVKSSLNPDGHYESTSKTCSDVYCHSDGKNPDGKGTIKWTDTGVGCNTCHDVKTLSGAHPRHLEVGKTCGDCHKMSVNSPGAPDPLLHLNGKVDVTFDLSGLNPKGSYDALSKTCSGLYCHSDGKTPDAEGSQIWAAKKLDCKSCHQPDTLSGKHDRHTNLYGFDCAECHKNVVKGENDKLVDPLLHVNGIKDVSFEKSPLNPSGQYTSLSKSCSGLYCHSAGTNLNATGTAKWDAQDVGCNACHPKDQLSSKHAKHVGAYNFSCSECHKTAKDHTTIDPTQIGLHVNGTKDVAFDNSQLNKNTATFSVTKTCSGLYCHSDGKTVDSVGEVNWGSTDIGCSSCHGQPPSDKYFHGLHTTSVKAKCGHCHPAGSTTSNDMIGNFGLHVNQIKEFSPFGHPEFVFGYDDVKKWDTCTGTCHVGDKSKDHQAVPWL